VSAQSLAALLRRVVDNTISGKIAKDVFEAMWDGQQSADAIIEARGLRQITDESAIETAIDAVILANPGQLADYRSGKEAFFGFFVGAVMKATQGKANPAQVNELLKKSSVADAIADRRTATLHPRTTRCAGSGCSCAARGGSCGVQPYPPVVEVLLGEAATAAVLLAATLKFDGKLTLQLTGNGLVTLLVAQCTHDFHIRAVARHHESVPETSAFAELVGTGRLVVTIEASERGTRYQGIVPLAGNTMAACLEAYVASSEQLPTRLALASSTAAASGLLIQKLPEAVSGEAGGAVLQTIWEDLQAGPRRFARAAAAALCRGTAAGNVRQPRLPAVRADAGTFRMQLQSATGRRTAALDRRGRGPQRAGRTGQRDHHLRVLPQGLPVRCR
jgi:hypothetical protein